MKNNINEIRNEILKLKNDGMNNEEIGKIMNLSRNTISYHLKKLKYVHKKIKCECENIWCGKKFEIVEFEYDEKLHRKCRECRLYEKNCPICGKKHNRQGESCSKKCGYELKKLTWSKKYGDTHIFGKNSSIRKNMNDNLMKTYGVKNNFQREDVKLKIKKTLNERYGVDHPSQIMDNYIRRRLIGETIGILIPIEELTEYQIYRNNVHAFTSYNLRIFGYEFFGENWKNSIGCRNSDVDNNIDHIFSIKNGFIKKIEPYIIGSIINLRMIKMYDNLSKKDRSDITIEELYENFKNFEKDENHRNLLKEMRNKRSKYYNYYIENKIENEN